MYCELAPDFYHKTKYSLNPVSSWYIRNRYSIIHSWVSANYSDGKKILDIGCGGSIWNENGKFPVIGLDLNPSILDFGKRNNHLSDSICSDFEVANLPRNHYDIVILSEVLEHTINPIVSLKKISEITRKGGLLILTVPYDTTLSVWKYLFSAQCFLMGSIIGEEYYKQKCGHIHHFSPAKIRSLLASVGFSVLEERLSMRMNIAVLARKN